MLLLGEGVQEEECAQRRMNTICSLEIQGPNLENKHDFNLDHLSQTEEYQVYYKVVQIWPGLIFFL